MLNKKKIIAGVDEVGKGSLFGPVFAGAVILNKTAELKLINAGLKDSKELSAKKRSKLLPIIQEQSTYWAIGQSSAREIDRYGIRVATEKAIIRALQRLYKKPDLVLVDGKLPIRLWPGNQITLIKGESKSAAIAAASVVAKEMRDSLIKRLALDFPNYGIEKNMGYGTELHRKSLILYGSTRLHRKSFLSKIVN